MEENKLNKNQFYLANYGTMENIEIFKDFDEAKKESIDNKVFLADLDEDSVWEEEDGIWNYEDCSDLFLTTPILVSKCPQCEEVDAILEEECVCSYCDFLNRKNDYLNGVVEINESNIPLYYEFMSKDDISKYRNIIHFSFNKRLPLNIEDLLDIDKEVIIVNWKYDTFSSGRVKSQSFFGVKDILKPLDEYIEEIKQSAKYQEYIKKSA